MFSVQAGGLGGTPREPPPSDPDVVQFDRLTEELVEAKDPAATMEALWTLCDRAKARALGDVAPSRRETQRHDRLGDSARQLARARTRILEGQATAASLVSVLTEARRRLVGVVLASE